MTSKATCQLIAASSAQKNGHLATWALAVAQLVSWGSVYYGFSLFVVPMEHSMGWSKTDTNAALSLGLLVSGLAAYSVGTWIDHGHGRKIMVAGSILSGAMLLLWSQAHTLATLFVVWAGLGISMAATLYDPVFAIVTRDYPGSFRTKITLITLVAGFASTVFIPLTQGFVKLAALVSWPRNIDLSSLNDAERTYIESACSYDKNINGPAAFNRCLSSKLQQMSQ